MKEMDRTVLYYYERLRALKTDPNIDLKKRYVLYWGMTVGHRDTAAGGRAWRWTRNPLTVRPCVPLGLLDQLSAEVFLLEFDAWLVRFDLPLIGACNFLFTSNSAITRVVVPYLVAAAGKSARHACIPEAICMGHSVRWPCPQILIVSTLTAFQNESGVGQHEETEH
ncbi:hypothetical protein ElyMa_004383000 [Elysia marginata]|uniref:Uncharacterized protein n=1 Tax=Elysia marginata TaxID=1093978 RepID=A0AAV4H5V1_9GAST|nr:hypothetical protein ElyMa_004383000 [Elysia marginata]